MWTERTAWTSPQKLTASNRNYLRQLIQGLLARGGTDPWRHTHRMVEDQKVKEVVLLSDGGTWTGGSVRLGGKYYSGESLYHINLTMKNFEKIIL